ncbi:hypothetical protein CDAR_492221 [Caerostris darwini]|uniref:Uncharacterized protein n=1 Tax=Caerostris darwini TaxID=1538125 RepID=A0AAV4UZR8_9ARAC|nr:hypothetical protein CDAR_492221 [Caerostris darwini]
MLAIEDFITLNLIPLFSQMIDYVYENPALTIILASVYTTVWFLFTECLTPMEEVKQTAPAFDDVVVSPQQGNQGAKDITRKDNNYHGNLEKTGPLLQSKAVWAMCVGLGIPANFDPESDGKGFVIKNKPHSKNIPIVHSQNVFMFCQALGLKAKLAKKKKNDKNI